MNGIVPKIMISVICIFLIVLLFSKGNRIFPETDSAVSSAKDESANLDLFRFDSEEITYDGTDDLDLLEGVSLVGFTDEQLKDRVFTKIYGGSALSEKIVQYTAETDKGRASSTRKIRLENYSGPEILLPDTMPKVTPETIEGLGILLKTKSGYAVDDGFGNDVCDYADIQYEIDMKDSSLVHYKISFENMFGDRVVVEPDVVLSGVPARIVLTDSEITLRIGETFDPLAYIELAEMANGDSAIREVHFEGDVDTLKKGEYTVGYELEKQKVFLKVDVE